MLALATRSGCCTLKVFWQGGEILCLSPDSVHRGLDGAEQVFRDSGIAVEHYLQTNLLLYDTGRWKDVLLRFQNGNVSSSVDFPNVYRRAGSRSGDEYNRYWLEKKNIAERDGIRVSVIALPNSETLELGAQEFYRYYRDELRVRALQVNLPFQGNAGPPVVLDLERLSAFMVELYETWLRNKRDLYLSPFTYFEDRIFGAKITLPCIWSYTCAKGLVCVGPDGQTGQCDCLVATRPEYNYGSFLEGSMGAVLSSPNRNAILDRPLRLARETSCGECRFWAICHGGCPIRALAFTGNIQEPDHYCQVYQAMFSAIVDRTVTPWFVSDTSANPITGKQNSST
ncbi:MAG: SPASM domain-containing protein [Candidatus Hydrogenedentes bacterium]|nr:SPASM domain-containing protein [Candidatus Hydrogenedentota bacterium]